MKFAGQILGLGIVISLLAFYIVRSQPWFSGFNAQQLLKKYSQEEIDHFASFAFQEGELKKWRKDIKFKTLAHSHRDILTNELTLDCTKILDTLLDEINIQFDTDYYNLSLIFMDSMVNDRLGYGPTLAATFCIPYPTIKSGRVEVFVGDLDSENINSTIYHEFSHVLGFHHNYLVDYQSVFNPGPRKLVETPNGEELVPSFKTYSDLDKAAIRIMYDADVAIDPGLTKEKFFRLIEKAKKEMEE